jgi:hypothetical protein
MTTPRSAALSTLAALLAFALSARAETNKPFEVKSGVVESVMTLPGMGKTEEVLYFDDYGRKQAKYSTTTVDVGQLLVNHKLEIQLPDGTSYNIDLDEKTGSTVKIPPAAAAALGTAMAPSLLKDAKVKDLPAKEFLGHQCKGTEVEAMGMLTRTWTWKGIALYSEADAGKGGDKPVVIRATKLTEGPVPADKFKPPAGVRLEKMSDQ